jgi:DNA polymerase elongation subunit (family B)
MSNKKQGPRVLALDIETMPILANVWQIWGIDNIGLNQIERDWSILAWCAKWLGESKIHYADQRNNKNLEDDKKILQKLHQLLNEADVVVTQNGKAFDIKKINARFIINNMPPVSSFKHIDTKQVAKSKFGFTSNSLEYMSQKLNLKHKKSKHKRYPGFELWKAVMAGDKSAWEEMRRYNIEDVLTLENLYNKLAPWMSNHPDFNIYHDSEEWVCRCGSKDFGRNGFAYTSTGKFQRYVCKQCGAESRSKDNLLTKNKKKSLRV